MEFPKICDETNERVYSIHLFILFNIYFFSLLETNTRTIDNKLNSSLLFISSNQSFIF
jgi:hypothetical protein